MDFCISHFPNLIFKPKNNMIRRENMKCVTNSNEKFQSFAKRKFHNQSNPAMGCANAVYTSWILSNQGEGDSNSSRRKGEKLYGFDSSSRCSQMQVAVPSCEVYDRTSTSASPPPGILVQFLTLQVIPLIDPLKVHAADLISGGIFDI
ncbi:hypothetical protein WH47_01904 [Habropoda laboriosa]|uniref:Uncharacterized protein n=1 Tax=Habropoda laboriosa TaxID=597456 RepID=A0A0L7QXR9_9HYME|nr:hypothetical protein WH47_01904 [Habropoda laboriosa]